MAPQPQNGLPVGTITVVATGKWHWHWHHARLRESTVTVVVLEGIIGHRHGDGGAIQVATASGRGTLAVTAASTTRLPVD